MIRAEGGHAEFFPHLCGRDERKRKMKKKKKDIRYRGNYREAVRKQDTAGLLGERVDSVRFSYEPHPRRQ